MIPPRGWGLAASSRTTSGSWLTRGKVLCAAEVSRESRERAAVLVPPPAAAPPLGTPRRCAADSASRPASQLLKAVCGQALSLAAVLYLEGTPQVLGLVLGVLVTCTACLGVAGCVFGDLSFLAAHLVGGLLYMCLIFGYISQVRDSAAVLGSPAVQLAGGAWPWTASHASACHPLAQQTSSLEPRCAAPRWPARRGPSAPSASWCGGTSGRGTRCGASPRAGTA